MISWRSHPWRSFTTVALLALALSGVERLAARLFEPQHAAWIWADGDYSDGEPIAFYAVREVELPAAGSGRILIAADETYLLYVNGQRIGAGSYRAEQPFDVYEVGDFLDAGVNRIVVELRSSRGAGGLFARLEIGDVTLGTDGSWRVFRRHHPGLLRGWALPEGGEAPKVWARAPTGRWRLAGARQQRIPFQHFPPPRRDRPIRHQLHHGATWDALDPNRRIPALGPQQVFDWGEEVEGFLSFDLRSGSGDPGLLYVSNEPPDAGRRLPDTVILPIPGRKYWADAHPRRFRYALVVGAEPASRIEVELLNGSAGDRSTSEDNHDGVFGIEPPRSYSKVEEDVWGRLEAAAAERAATR